MSKKIFLFTVVVSLVISTLGVSQRAMSDDETYRFRSARAAGVVDRIESTLKVGGDLKVIEKSKLRRPKIAVTASLDYEEKTLVVEVENSPLSRSLRYYDKSEAVIKVGEGAFKPVLRKEQRLIGVDIDDEKITLFGPRGPLTREELDMIDLLGNSLLLDRLLPEKPVAKGDSWEHSAELIADILGLDAVAKTDVKSTLSKVTPGAAQIEMQGKVSGAIAGVSSEIKVRAKYLFDIRQERIVWFAISVNEDRDVGHIGPGLEVTAQMQMKITPNIKPIHLVDSNLMGLSLAPDTRSETLIHRSVSGGWQFVHDRRWFITNDANRSAMLAMVDQGDFLAQCKIASMLHGDEAKNVTLAKFQQDIRRGLGKAFKQFVAASQRENRAGYREFRVEIAGLVEEVPIHWIYYLLTDQHGHQVLFAFTLEQPLIERFGKSDRILIASVRLVEPKVAKSTTPKKRRER